MPGLVQMVISVLALNLPGIAAEMINTEMKWPILDARGSQSKTRRVNEQDGNSRKPFSW